MSNKGILKNLVIYLYITDMCLVPTLHIAGFPFKFAYVIGLIWLVLYAFQLEIRVGKITFYSNQNNVALKNSTQAHKMILCLYAIILVTIVGDMTAMVYTQLVDINPLRNAIVFYIVLICSMGIGYTKFDFNKDFLVIILILFCSVNIMLSALGPSCPYFIRGLYKYVGEGESKFNLLRIVGTMGNPNATLCVMNTLFMSIIVFIRKNQIEIENKVKLLIIIAFPLLTICFINSRGEFLITALLEAILLSTIFQKQRDIFNSMMWILAILLVAVVVLNLLFPWLVQNYPTVAYSIDRLGTIFSSDSNTATDSLSDRPFIHFQEFIDRFVKSPIWGTGFSEGYSYPFLRSCERYHNDWFRIIASGGIIGLGLWVYLIYIAVKKCGIFYILPFFVTAISNTFIASPPAIGLYFMTVMVLIRIDENGFNNNDLRRNSYDYQF